jgi:hypothetical protein
VETEYCALWAVTKARLFVHWPSDDCGAICREAWFHRPRREKSGCFVQNLHFLSKSLVLFAKANQFSRIRLLAPLGFNRAKRLNLQTPRLQLRARNPQLLGNAALRRTRLIKSFNRCRFIIVCVFPSMLSHSVPLSWTGVKYPNVREQGRGSI